MESEMKQHDEDLGYEQRRQARIDAENWDMKQSIPIHQKVGTVIPFSRTVDRDPNPRIPLSIPELRPVVTKGEALFWVVLVGAWLAFSAFWPGAW
jgi:hypothetical protein